VNSLGPDFDTLLTRGALVALALAAGWAVVMVVAVALEARTAGRVQIAERAGCPAVVRLWLLGVFVALFATAAPAGADERGTAPADTATATTLDPALDGLPLPDRVAGAPTRTVVVQPGDSLWRIARALLPDHASDRVIAALVDDLHAANRRTIGPDPDLLQPGQRLLVDHSDTFLEAR
jgi:nucleoid-associated protein YgaU